MVNFAKLSYLTAKLLTTVLLLYSSRLSGQGLLSRDTIVIKEVIISGKAIESHLPGFRKIIIDTALIESYSYFSLSELLTAASPVFIKCYGPSGTATSSLRGTGASHTQVTWNGININSKMLGQTDLSLITPYFADNVQVNPGGASMEFVTGGIGGEISLESKPSWKSGTVITLNPGVGSFGKRFLQGGVKAGNKSFYTVTKLNLDCSENDFVFLNNVAGSEPFMERRTDNQVSHKDLLQEIYFRKNKIVSSARLWYGMTDRNLPGSILSQSGSESEEQYDESVRILISVDDERNPTNWFIKGAWVFDRLDYFNPLASIESFNRSNSFVAIGGIETSILYGTTLRLILNEEFCAITSNNYISKAVDNITSFTLLAERKTGNRLASSILLKETMANGKLLLPDFSAGFEFRIFPDGGHILRAGISRISRLPSMNEKYWYPGGNENLKNENAYVFDCGYRFNSQIVPALKVTSEIGFFRNLINDMIQWRPGEYSFWTADNIGRVITRGIESSLSLSYSRNLFAFNFALDYSWTCARSAINENDDGFTHQLIYIPEHQAGMSFITSFRKMYASIIMPVTGKRYTTVDNSSYLPGYSISSIKTGIKLPFGRNTIDASLMIDNFFNVSYETVAFYPQPGRSFLLGVRYQFDKNISK